MDVDLIALSKIVVPAATATATVVGAVIKAREVGGRRAVIKRDLELLEALPSESASRSDLLAYVDDRVKALVEYEKTASREVAFGVFALISAGLLIWASFALISKGGWGFALLVPVLFLLLVMAYGVGVSFIKAPRDEKGNVKPTSS